MPSINQVEVFGVTYDIEGSGGGGSIDSATYVATYGSTTFADIQQAIADGKCVKCDVSGYTYELVQALSDKITFALTNNVNGSIVQETIWVTSDNEWDGESISIAKASDVLKIVTATSEEELPSVRYPNTFYAVVKAVDPASDTEG